MEQPRSDYQRTIEETRHWASDLASGAPLIGQRFARAEPRQRATADLRGLVSPTCLCDCEPGWRSSRWRMCWGNRAIPHFHRTHARVGRSGCREAPRQGMESGELWGGQ